MTCSFCEKGPDPIHGPVVLLPVSTNGREIPTHRGCLQDFEMDRLEDHELRADA